MKLITLLENTAVNEGLTHAHGLSLYLETPRHRILFDMGPDDGFLNNAKALGVDIAAVDIAFLSHGHDDHGGGLEAFFQANTQAKVYLHQAAFGPYYALLNGEPHYIGLPEGLAHHRERFVLCRGHQVIDEELQVFSDLKTDDLRSGANATLRRRESESLPPDEFFHEQSLLVTAEGQTLLLAGCAHRGIVNILRRAEEILGKSPDRVFSGFHLCNPGTGVSEPAALIKAVAGELKARPTHYCTGHCTGHAAYALLQERLGAQMAYMSGGSTFSL